MTHFVMAVIVPLKIATKGDAFIQRWIDKNMAPYSEELRTKPWVYKKKIDAEGEINKWLAAPDTKDAQSYKNKTWAAKVEQYYG
jgi:hypothetical protein